MPLIYYSAYPTVSKLAVGNPHRLEVAATPLYGHTPISVYKQVKVRLPSVRQVSSDGRVHVDIIHATPTRDGPHRLSTIPANMSTVLARAPGSSGDIRSSLNIRKPLEGTPFHFDSEGGLVRG